MRLAIVGGRDFTDKELFNKIVDRLLQRNMFANVSQIVSGGAKGTDTLAENYADEHGFDKNILKADWNKHGRSAGFIRNHKIMVNSDIGIAFWDGESSGTGHSVELFLAFKKSMIIVKYKIFIISKKVKKFKIEKIYLAEK